MEKEKSERRKEIIVLDKGIDIDTSSDAARGWGMCCWANIMPVRGG